MIQSAANDSLPEMPERSRSWCASR